MNNEGGKESSLRHLPPGKLDNIRQMFEATATRTNPVIHKPRPATTLFSPSSEFHKEKKEVSRRPATTPFTDDGTMMQEKERQPPKIRYPKPLRVPDKPRPKSELCKPAIDQALQQINRDITSPNKGSSKKQTPKPRERSPNKQGLNPSEKSLTNDKEGTKSVERSSMKPTVQTKPFQNVDQISIVTTETKQNEEKKTEKLLNTSRSDRPVSVLQRTKMFENIESAESPVSPVHTLRKKSEDAPIIGGEAIDSSEPENPYCAPWDSKLRVSKQLVVLKLPKSPPPKKPPRTRAHDDYMQTKVFQKKTPVQSQNVIYDTVPDDEENNDTGGTVEPVYRRIQKIQSAPAISPEKRRSSEDGSKPKPEKPQRPPPPRPASISSDEYNENRHAHPVSTLKKQHEKKKAHFDLDLDEVKFWDLPQDRSLHRSELRRSLSAECIAKDISGDPVYIDPVEVNFRDDTGSPVGYEVYVDPEGYAVPYRHRQLDKTASWDTERHHSSSKPFGDAVKLKLGGLKKKLFSPDPNIRPKMESQMDTLRNRKKKLQIVKQRISLAFAVLDTWKREVEKEEPSETSTSTDEDSLVDVKEIVKRIEHCTLVRQRTFKGIKKTREVQQQIYPQLFDYALIVTLQPKEGTTNYEPKIIYKFPDHLEPNISVPQFCFPDASDFDVKSASPAAKSESYSFVLTNEDGERVYGYCRRFVPFRTPAGLPEVVCIISPVNAFSMYNSLLDEIEKHRQVNLETAQELIAAAFGRPLPNPGNVVHVRTLDEEGEMGTIFLKRSLDSRVDNVNCDYLLKLGYDKLMKLFSCILLERSVLFCAKNLSTLSQTVQALSSLLYPFHWQHTYIPVLPESMIDIVCSPTPYLIGISTSNLPQVEKLPVEQVVIIDLDKKQLLRSQGDEGTLLPKKLQKAIKAVLNLCKIDSEVKGMQNLMLSEAFLRLFVEVVGHYGEHIYTQQDNKKVFQKENFIKNGLSESVQQFLEWFTETQMFEVFMTDQLENRGHEKTLELFNSRVMEYKTQVASGKDIKQGQKMKCIKKLLKAS